MGPPPRGSRGGGSGGSVGTCPGRGQWGPAWRLLSDFSPCREWALGAYLPKQGGSHSWGAGVPASSAPHRPQARTQGLTWGQLGRMLVPTCGEACVPGGQAHPQGRRAAGGPGALSPVWLTPSGRTRGGVNEGGREPWGRGEL